MVNDIFGVDLPNEASDFLFDLPFSIDEQCGNDSRDENASKNASSDLRISQTVIRFFT